LSPLLPLHTCLIPHLYQPLPLHYRPTAQYTMYFLRSAQNKGEAQTLAM
jgi:hypothetical protein